MRAESRRMCSRNRFAGLSQITSRGPPWNARCVRRPPLERTMTRPLTLFAALAILVGLAAPVFAGNYVVYLQGRGWASWNGETLTASGWTNVTLSFNGNAVLNGAETNTTVKNAISTYCSGGNHCIIHCYSA